MKQISLFYAENVLKMRKMQKSVNYADPHHRILSDALHLISGVLNFVIFGNLILVKYRTHGNFNREININYKLIK